MLGRLLTSNPSRLNPIRSSTSFACLACCGSATGRQAGDQSAQRQLVTVGAEPTEDRLCTGRQCGMPALWFAREDVRQVHLDVRNRNRGERVTDRETAVGIRAGVDN